MVYHADQGTGAWADSEKIVDRPLSWAVYYLRFYRGQWVLCRSAGGRLKVQHRIPLVNAEIGQNGPKADGQLSARLVCAGRLATTSIRTSAKNLVKTALR